MLKLKCHGITSILAIQFNTKKYYFNVFALIKSLYIGIVNVIIHVSFIATPQTLQRRTIVDALAKIAAHFAEFRNIYCCVGNTVIISTSMV